MPKFQSTVNPKEIIDVTEEMAMILRQPIQTGWKEYFEEVKPSGNVPANNEQSDAPTKGKRGRKRQPR